MASLVIDASLRRVVRLVALLNLGYFGIEFAVALFIGSVSLFADSIDFLEDCSVNFLIAVALGWTARHRARVGMATGFATSAWPDLIVGLGIAAMNADAAREVWQAARDEHRSPAPLE
jgi:Co/Zn/Cd efflux system component